MSIQFTIHDWAAYAPGLQDQAAWKEWSEDAFLPEGDDVPALSEMPAMQRRRLERVGRTALQVAYWCQTAEVADIPLVFASRHGDIQRTYEMLEVLARKEALSPTHFGLSIHNAIVAQYSIARQLKQNYLAVAAGLSTAEAAVIEAIGLLNDGHDEVMVVMYDGLLPESYQQFQDEAGAEYAWAWRMKKAESNPVSGTFSLEIGAGDRSEAGSQSSLPHGLDVMRFVLSNETGLHFFDGSRHWNWYRHA
ncbi:MAG: beta-ketoacyl synthase chain length factor [Arenimonas sp.]